MSSRGFSPLTGFVSQADYTSIVNDMKLTDGTIFGLPIVLDTDSEDISVGDKVLLTYQGEFRQLLTIGDYACVENTSAIMVLTVMHSEWEQVRTLPC